tara:strand:- start:1847 stop:2509 length:663 start_codon:yes stop_codon:yes gene_type:complete
VPKNKIYPELETIGSNNTKPVIICDADQVIFNFMDGLIKYLKKNDLLFKWKSYALNGNIINKQGVPLSSLEIKLLLKDFFLNCTSEMSLIKGAKSSLKKLSTYFDIIILSNIPFDYYEQRKLALKKNHLNFPFIANKGGKGETCHSIFNMFNKRTWFIDDSPHQILSVKQAVPKISTILYINDIRLAKLLDNEKCWDYYSNTWNENLKIFMDFINYDRHK